MITRDESLGPEEWHALGDSEAQVYKDLARSFGLDMNDSRDGRILDSLYKLHVDSVWTLPVEIPRRILSTPPRSRNTRAAHEANRTRGLQTLRAVKQAHQELSSPCKPTPSIKAIAWLASCLLDRKTKPLSNRRTLELIAKLRAGGQIG